MKGYSFGELVKLAEAAVPQTRKINNKPLSSDINLSAADVGAVPNSRRINNKSLSSDVNLTAFDVGATVSKQLGDGVDCNSIIDPGTYDINTQSAKNWPFDTSGGSMIVSKHTGGTYVTQLAFHGANNQTKIRTKNAGSWTAWKTVYNEDFRPSATDVGAVDRSEVNTNQSGGWPTVVNKIPRVNSDGVLEVGKYIDFHDRDDTTDFSARLEVVGKDLKVRGGKLLVGNSEVYHQGFKPTAADVGAVPNTRKVNNKTLNSDISLTASDVGAAPAGFGLGSTSFVSRGSINRLMDNGWQEYNSGVGDLDGPYAQGNVLHIGHKGNATSYAGWAAQLFMAVNGSMFTRRNESLGSFSGSKWYRIYTEKDKPAATDVSAVEDTATVLGDVNYSTLGSSFALTASGPKDAPASWAGGSRKTLISVNRSDYRLQIMGDTAASNRLAFRTSSLNATMNGWSQIYHEGFKPAPAELGAAAASHTHTAKDANSDIVNSGYGQVGTYAMLGRFDGGGQVNPGQVVSGSVLRYCNAEGVLNGASPAGNWKALGYAKGDRDYGPWNVTLFIRVS